MLGAVGLFLVSAAIAWYLYKGGGAQCIGDAPGHCYQQETGCNVLLTFDECFQLATNAGFGSDANTAAAIALAESHPRNDASHADSTAYNKEPQDVPGRYHRESADDGLGSVGLWQIYRAAHPEFDEVDLTDPSLNAMAAFAIYEKAGGFSPWSTFKSGAYQNFLQ